MAQKNFRVYFRFYHCVLLKLENSFSRSKLCPSSWLPLPWCCFRDKSRKGSPYEQYCCTALPTSSPMPGDGRTQTSAPSHPNLSAWQAQEGEFPRSHCCRKQSLAGGAAGRCPQAAGGGFWGGLRLHREMGHCYVVWATSCWRFFCSVINHYWKHKDYHRFNVAHLKKEVFKVSFTNETNSHTLKRKCGIESIKAEKKHLK